MDEIPAVYRNRIPKGLLIDAQQLADPEKELGEPITDFNGRDCVRKDYVEALLERLSILENSDDPVVAQRAMCIGVELYFFLYDEDSND